MGQWMLLPVAEDVIAGRINRFGVRARKRRAGSIKWEMRISNLDDISGLISNVDPMDFANMADVADVPPWECEIPLTDDGF